MNGSLLPAWLPWWVPIIVLIPVGLWALTMVLMPFSVIGLKSRLEGIEARLDEIQAEIRSLVLRLPESAAERVSYSQDYYEQPRRDQPASRTPDEPPRPPIPPRPRDPEPARDALRADRPAPSPRAEPRFDWRR